MEKDNRKQAIVLGYVHTILHTVIGIVYVPILLGCLGESAYGLYQMASSVIAYLTIIESTLSASVLRQYTLYLVKGDMDGTEHVLYLSRKMYRILSGLIVGVAMVLAIGMYFFYRNSLTAPELREFFLIYGILVINILVSVNNYTYLACINAHQRFVFLKVLSLIVLILQPLGVLALLQIVPYATVIVAVELCLNVIVAVVRYRYAKTELKVKVRKHPEYGDALMKSMLVFSVGTFLTVVADQIFWKTDQIILGKMQGTSAVAVYSVGVQVFYAFMALSSGVGGVLLPTIVSKIEKEGMAEVDAFFRKVGRIQGYILGLMLTGFTVLGRKFMLLWVGEGYEEAYVVAVMLMFAYAIDIIQGTVGISVLQVLNKYSFRAKCMFTIALINIALTVAAVKVWGLVGAAAATAVSMLIGSGLIMNVYYHKVIGLKIGLFWKDMVKIFLLWGICIGIGYGVSFLSLNHLWIDFLLQGILFVVIYAGLAYFFVMNENEKDRVHALVRRLKCKK